MSATVAPTITKTSTDLVVKSGTAAIAGFQELAKAYQALATKSAKRLGSSLQALAAVKSPTEFVALQGKLMSEAVDAAIKDGANISKLTTEVFTAAFEPLTKPFAAVSQSGKV